MNINNDIGTTYLITNKKMTLVAILGITLGMSIYIFMNCMVVGFDKTSNDSIFKNTAHIRVFRDDVVSRPLAPDITKKAVIINPKVVPASNTIINPDEVVSLAKKHPDVVNVTPQVTTTMFYNIGKTQVPGIATGILPNEADQMFNIRSTIVEGSFEKPQSNLNAIAIGSGVAEKLSLAIDDNINISSPKGVSKNMKIVAIFKTNNSIVDKSKSYINLSTAQQLLRENNTYVTDINVNVKDPENCDQISKDLKVLTGYSSESWKQANETMVAGFRMRRIVITFISYTILIVAGFGTVSYTHLTLPPSDLV